MKSYDVIVVGAGPAGIMAAIQASREGASTLLLEKNSIIGRKILATGNGRCNITNTRIDSSRYHGSIVSLFAVILEQFSSVQTIKYFESLGVILKEENNGRLFPITNQAQTVVDALSHELDELGAEILTSVIVKEIVQSPAGWSVLLDGGNTYQTKALIVTTGGRAAHQFGSSGDGLFWLKKLGLREAPISAALVAIDGGDESNHKLAGLKMNVNVASYRDDLLVGQAAGDMIFTHTGLSGPAAMSLAADLFSDKDGVKSVSIDFLPNLSSERIESLIMDQISSNPKKSIRNIIAAFLPDKLAIYLLAKSNVALDLKSSELSKGARNEIINQIKSHRISVTKPRPLKEAQVTRGGIYVTEVNDKLEVIKFPGLFLAGEILDIDGDSGGFNLQWAWSSGAVAGLNAARKARI